ncbi:NfeD family protein [Polycladidibacter hongkongensis]|uniref:NfeD family protein n=1 Tax=Polycladidibacter hongkongensis TaxID=1647556 RepID=UPI00082F55A0|nr:NfeD family protein [Pseudovibrio hongkongensis]
MTFLEAFLSPANGWLWLSIGLVLMVLELAAPGAFLIWFGLAAVIVGLVVATSLISIGWQMQLLLFALLALVLVVVGRRFFSGAKADDAKQSTVNDPSQRFVGTVVKLHEPIEHGRGRVQIGDSVWRVQGPDLASGCEVKVVAVEGTTLQVEAV